jgi:hypothetical protein
MIRTAPVSAPAANSARLLQINWANVAKDMRRGDSGR